ncbi:MAG: hypothetical protein Kow0059_12320 [Candidatus Sumerlaeia bacterium]
MKWTVATEPAGRITADALVVITDSKRALADLRGTGRDGAPEQFQSDVKAQRVKAPLVLPLERARAGRLVLVSVDLEKPCHPWPERVKMAAAQALNVCRSLSLTRPAFVVNGRHGAAAAPLVVEGAVLGTYRFEEYLKEPERFAEKLECTLVVPRSAAGRVKREIGQTQIVADAVNYARDLVNRPFPQVNPQSLAAEAQGLAGSLGLQLEVLEREALEREKFSCLLGVGQGSREYPPVMIVMRYVPDGAAQRGAAARLNLGLVGKAVTFDTGGVCIKPASKMWEMKGDMAGGAAVLGAMRAIAQLRPPVRVTAVIPAVHNAVSDTALHPGQILRHRSGKSIHVDNTDAEGRLILIDAFEKARDERVTHLIDLATLTGSCVRALGEAMCGGFSNNERLMAALRAAGDAAGEMIWPLPLHEEYLALMKHPAADINNVGSGVNAGAITAALFLKEFVPAGRPWVHLDIAGPFLVTSPWKYFCEGGTGFGVRTLVRFVQTAARAGL